MKMRLNNKHIKLLSVSSVLFLLFCFLMSSTAASPPQGEIQTVTIQGALQKPAGSASHRATLEGKTYWFGESGDSNFNFPAFVAQKRGTPTEALNIDASVAPLTGKRVFYVLLDEEGASQLEATGQGRKVPALIVYNYRGRRDDHGRLVSPLLIFRPGFAGGLLSKDEVAADSSRTPGTWDTIQPGDFVN
jgi:hypothetical protein